jgi:hypothetical protein
MTDLLIYETGSGGDLLISGNDLAQVQGYENSPYLAMFGGGDWWGNYLLPTENQFNSQTEQTLNTTPLSSAGRQTIEAAIKADLAYLDNIEGTTWSVTTAIGGKDRLQIYITINGQTFYYLWNPNQLFLTYQVI